MRSFSTNSVHEIIESFAMFSWPFHRDHRKKPSGPGQAVMECDEETREKFRKLKSDDLSNVRPDIAAMYGCAWNWEEPWQVNHGLAPPTKMPEYERIAMLLQFEHDVLGKNIDLSLYDIDVRRTLIRLYEDKRNKRPPVSGRI